MSLIRLSALVQPAAQFLHHLQTYRWMGAHQGFQSRPFYDTHGGLLKGQGVLGGGLGAEQCQLAEKLARPYQPDNLFLACGAQPVDLYLACMYHEQLFLALPGIVDGLALFIGSGPGDARHLAYFGSAQVAEYWNYLYAVLLTAGLAAATHGSPRVNILLRWP
jgi:hypothetical protein